MKRLARYLKIGLGCSIAAVAVVAAMNAWVVATTQRFVVKKAEDLPRNDVGLVLGTSRFTPGGYSNPFFQGRITAAAHLYSCGKVRHLLLTGDNHTRGYDEPADMRDGLLALGVPSQAMTADDAGFRTLDSVVRARQVFQLDRFTIITDDFHVNRAEFLARHEGVEAVAFCSASVPLKWSLKTRIREVGSRVRAFLDVYVLQTKPRFLGPKLSIPLATA